MSFNADTANEARQLGAGRHAANTAQFEAEFYLKPLRKQLVSIQELIPEADSFLVNEALGELHNDLEAAALKLSAAITKVGE